MSVNLALLWHMHQPYYFDPLKGKFMLPWVRLHATKDYLDMVIILKEFPEVKVTFNLVPSLLKQLKEYEDGRTDIFLEYTLIPADELTKEQKIFLLENFFLANWKTMIEPLPRYAQLLEKRGRRAGDFDKKIKEFSSQDFRDLQLLFNLVWIDPLHRSRDPFLRELIKKGKDFTEEEKKLIIEKHFEIIKKVIPTYKEMAMTGRIELTVSPFYHPILPLIYDISISKKCMPEVVLPKNHFHAPEDAEMQIKTALEYFVEIFGIRPKGMWPSEGSVSEEILRLIKESKIEWIATDEEILSKSIGKNLREGEFLIDQKTLYQVYDFEGLKIFFRDRILSDLIGFVYHSWNTEKAVSDLLYRIKKAPSGSIISIILDGENAWEYYENDGLDFLRRLYESLQKDTEIRTVTFSEYLEEKPSSKPLHKIFPGSWIGANFSIWIGHEEDNNSWDYLYKVRQDLVIYKRENPNIDLKDAWEEIYIAEGSDWNWWYGDEHYTETKDIFDEIYRDHLISVYLKIGKEPPAFLYIPICKKMREIKPEIEPKGFIYPKIDGVVTGYFEWLEAGKYNLQRFGGSMHKSEGLFSYLYFGFNRYSLFLRMDPYRVFEEFENLKIIINILEPKRIKIVWEEIKKPFAYILVEEEKEWIRTDEIATLAFKEILEIEIPFEKIYVKHEQDINFFIEAVRNSTLIERAPSIGFIKIHVPTVEFENIMWL